MAYSEYVFDKGRFLFWGFFFCKREYGINALPGWTVLRLSYATQDANIKPKEIKEKNIN